MSALAEFFKVNAKAVAGAVAGIILTAVQDVIAGNQPFPTTVAEWAKYLGTALISGMIVWATGNKATQAQVIKGAAQQGISVITDGAIAITQNAAENAVREAVSKVPLPAGSNVVVGNIIADVSQTVGNVMKGVAQNFDIELKDVL